ncbi:MAG TPA: hypothetical protein VD968_02795 [Pyrinomonadaceae bacterium]|nr:hypothetical protein [Pyrinomonadaceae bacterium]
MRSFLIRLSVALAAFVLGVTAAAAFGVSLWPRARHSYRKSIYVSPPARHRQYDCPKRMRSFEHPAPPVMPTLPEMPAPPAPPAEVETLPSEHGAERRIRIRRPDGSVEVIELKTEARPGGNF